MAGSILFAGSGEFGVPSLERLIARGHRVVGVYTQPDKPAGRGHAMTPTPIGKLAIERGLPLVRTPDINAEVLAPADVMVVIAFGQKIAPSIVDHARLGAINLHASRLPRYRGAAPIHRAILEGETETGNSVIRLAQKMDAGRVLAMSRMQIGPTETAGELHDRLAIDGADLVERVVDELLDSRATEIEQDHAQATLARKLSREISVIDFSWPAKQVANQIRGLFPWPGCRVQLREGGRVVATMTLCRARLPEANAMSHDDATRLTDVAGTIDRDGHVICGSGVVEILELQPQGKRPMRLSEFRNGHAWDAGMRLVSVA